MGKSEQEFLDEVRNVFATEAEEHLQTITAGLIEIEKQKAPSESQAVIESIFRAAHNLKGAARFVNLTGIGTVCQSVENVFCAMKNGALTLVSADFDVLQSAVDSMARMLASQTGEADAETTKIIEHLELIAISGKIASSPPKSPEVTPVPAKLPGAATPVSISAAPKDDGPKNAPAPVQANTCVPPGKLAADTIRITTEKLDSILFQAEELISIKLSAEQRMTELAEILEMFGTWKKECGKIAAKAEIADRIIKKQKAGNKGLPSDSCSSAHADSFDWSFIHMRELDARLSGLLAALHADHRTAGILVDQLLEDTKTILLQPFSTLLQTFPKMVRDISREQEKEADLFLNGAEIEIDKRILERMKDPLVHLLRNAIDHGLEKPDERLAHNKAHCGRINVNISQAEGNRVQILVSDDGAGIDAAKLRETAVKRGIISKEDADALDDQAALMLIFKSGFSTSNLITNLSGRGLGMAIVQEAVGKLGGRISIETKKGAGTAFHVSLPLTLATFHGMLLMEYGHHFAVPTANIERALRIRQEDVHTMENRETIMVNGTALSLVRLGAALGLEPVECEKQPMLSVVVLNFGSQRMAFSFDSLLHEQEILIKGLGKQLIRVRNIAGATVLGSGKVVPVLNVADLLKSAVRLGRQVSAPHEVKTEIRRKSILVVEDSITSRMLLKNILASAGFDVHIAVDGVEAWTSLKERHFDAVVSDIEMPRMNGFDLTRKIRADAKLAELPVVLVTALESRSDRERGIEVGADAYIIKSSFDQSNLLDVVRRLI